jgi:two-component system NtrC family sensor kinase
VSEQVQLQEQLVQSAKLSAIGQMISGVAHELNNPLTTVMGYAQLLLVGELDETVKADLQRIYDDALRAQRIVQDLLTFARQKKPERSPTDINETLERTLALRAYALEMDSIKLVTEFEEDLPWTMADGYQLQQVFLNIINNSYQAMAQQGKAGTLAVRSECIGGNTIRVTFGDTGPGIPDEVLKRIFDPFFTTKDVGMGTGLGLSVSHGIIQEHGGRIWAESDPGQGAVFVVELPVVRWPEEPGMMTTDDGAE